ncbi:MAG: PIN domain-containing protein [Propionibacteriaceae bacterium]|jgi:predicted nucleic acid-binding protein|nr:PIN domain-containing protein [Propionibacteriaceae bacterium]
MRVIIDTNVIIDVLERREAFFADSYAVCKLAAEGILDAFTPASSITDVHYIIRKSTQDASAARNAITTLLQLIRVCDTTAADITAALAQNTPDFEDAVLAATARREKAAYIITRDTSGFDNSAVPAISPSEFIASRNLIG